MGFDAMAHRVLHQHLTLAGHFHLSNHLPSSPVGCSYQLQPVEAVWPRPPGRGPLARLLLDGRAQFVFLHLCFQRYTKFIVVQAPL